MLAHIQISWRRPLRGERPYQPSEGAAIERELMRRVDEIHAASANGSAPPETLADYLSFLDAMPEGMRVCPKAIVAVALIDNMLAMDELKLEQRQLRRSLDAAEAATYGLLVRIGRKHGQIIGRKDA